MDELWHQLKQKHFQHDRAKTFSRETDVTYPIVPLSYSLRNIHDRPNNDYINTVIVLTLMELSDTSTEMSETKFPF